NHFSHYNPFPFRISQSIASYGYKLAWHNNHFYTILVSQRSALLAHTPCGSPPSNSFNTCPAYALSPNRTPSSHYDLGTQLYSFPTNSDYIRHSTLSRESTNPS
ncbi:hypothetical protein HK096_001808, partial [Nowakowskiella sp. JEL0078]